MTSGTGLAPVAVTSVVGEIDAATVGELDRAVRSLPPGDRLLDLTAVTFAGAAALGALVRLTDECAAQGSRLTIRPSGVVLDVARVAGLERSLRFV